LAVRRDPFRLRGASIRTEDSIGHFREDNHLVTCYMPFNWYRGMMCDVLCGLPGQVAAKCVVLRPVRVGGHASSTNPLRVVIGYYHCVFECNLRGRVWWYSSLPSVGKPLMVVVVVVVTVQGAGAPPTTSADSWPPCPTSADSVLPNISWQLAALPIISVILYWWCNARTRPPEASQGRALTPRTPTASGQPDLRSPSGTYPAAAAPWP
jgi:hypothetical protein